MDLPQETVVERLLRSLTSHSSLHPDSPAVIEAFSLDRTLTHKQIHDRALSFASFLLSRGFKMGDRVTIALSNSIEWPILGVWTAGGTIVGSSVAFKLSSSVVVTSEEMLDTMREAVRECSAVKMIICVCTTNNPLPDGIIDFEETLKHKQLVKIAPVTLDSECLIFYSSGTTGQPKGVIHTHRTFHCAIEMLHKHWMQEIYPALEVKEVAWYKESQLISSSCYHLMGFLLLNWFLITGSPIVLMKSFDGDIYEQTIEKFKPRFLLVTPPIFAYLSKDPKGQKTSLSSVQMMFGSGGLLGKDISEEFRVHHPTVKDIVQAYGATEIFFSHLPLLIEEGFNASGGVLTPYYEQKIIDPGTLKLCEEGRLGEICVRGTPQTIGYLNKEDETKALIDEEGWIHTGDVGYVDGRGQIYVVDRMKDLIKVIYMNQTMQVSPVELESLLLSHHSIRVAAVVGVPHSSRGELVRAYIVKEDKDLTEREVKEMVANNLAEYKQITGGVVFVDSIPKSPAGKILRRVLRGNC